MERKDLLLPLCKFFLPLFIPSTYPPTSSLTPSSSLIILPFSISFSLTYTLYTQQLGFVVDTAMHRPDSLPSRLKHWPPAAALSGKENRLNQGHATFPGAASHNNRSLVVSEDPFSLSLLGETSLRGCTAAFTVAMFVQS